jgi:hypothetical protein
MMTADFTRAADPSAADFWTHLHGWRRNPQIDGGTEDERPGPGRLDRHVCPEPGLDLNHGSA